MVLRPLQLTGDGEAASTERPHYLWRVLELIDEVAGAIAQERPLSDWIGSLLSQVHQRQEAGATVNLLMHVTAELARMLDPSRRRTGWLKPPGGSGKQVDARETGSPDPEKILRAVRQTLYLAIMCISTADQSPQDLAQELVDRKNRSLGEDDLGLIRDAAEIVFLACEKVLLVLKDSSIEAGD